MLGQVLALEISTIYTRGLNLSPKDYLLEVKLISHFGLLAAFNSVQRLVIEKIQTMLYILYKFMDFIQYKLEAIVFFCKSNNREEES